MDSARKTWMGKGVLHHAFEMISSLKSQSSFEDTTTPGYYPPLNLNTGQNSFSYLFSIRHQIAFYEAAGLGALKSKSSDGNPPFILSEAARFCFQMQKRANSNVLYLSLKKQTPTEYNDYVEAWDNLNSNLLGGQLKYYCIINCIYFEIYI